MGTMSFDPTAPVLALIIEPTDHAAALRPVAANESGAIGQIIGGSVQVIELDGGSVMWLNESGKNLGLPTNLLAPRSPTGSTPACSPTTRSTAGRSSWVNCPVRSATW